MKLLGKMLVCMLLAGCSQESLEFAQLDITPAPKPPPVLEPEEASLPEPPEVQPQPTTVESPEEGLQKVDPPPPKTEPAKPELTPEEIKARKLISDDPAENLEVLNQALDAWLATHEDLPEKIADLVIGDHLPMLPMAPVGQRFEIDQITKRVVLVANN